MTTPKDTIWDLEPHTLVKHQILRHYLSAWFPILGSAHTRVDYIDGFCGPGRYKTGEDGSRARGLAVLVCSPALMRIRCRRPEQMRMANAFCRLIEFSRAGDALGAETAGVT